MKRVNLLLSAVFTSLLLSCATTQPAKETEKSKETKTENTTQEVTKVEREFITNGLAGDCPAEYLTRKPEVSYGGVLHLKYYSNTCKMDRYYSILLPASYDENDTSKKYPVVYFQHGIFGDEKCMVYDGNNKFVEIAGNLFAAGKAPEMIFVFGNMYATDDPNQKPGFAADAVRPYDNYINELVNDLMPTIEAKFNVLTGRENTAVCGFSMGGRESLYIGLQRPDLFGYIGAIAPAPGLVPAQDWAMKHEGMISEDEMKFAEGATLPELFMICCGTTDRTVGQFPKSYHNIFEKNGVDHTWFEVINADHNSLAIRSGLYYFTSNIFKN